jgi:plasmid stability protein
MPDLLIRNVDPAVVDRLKARARRHRRSLQAEARELLEQAAGSEDLHHLLDAWEQRLAGRSCTSSAEAIREDRER